MVVWIGDSILRRMLQSIFGCRTFRTANGKMGCDFCIGGQTVQQLRRRLMKCKSYSSPWKRFLMGETVVLLIGTNNILSNPFQRYGHARRCMSWVLSTLKGMGVKKIFLCTLPPLFVADYDRIVQIVNKVLKDLSMQYGDLVVTVDVYSRFRNQRQLFEKDGIHPNRSGLRVLHETICGKIDSL